MARGRQVERQWAVLRALEGARRGLTPRELLEVCPQDCALRTLYRDLDSLQASGFPLVREDGRWRLLESGEGAWAVPLQPSHLLALLLTRDLIEPLRRTPFGAPLDELRGTLAAMLTPAGRAYVEELRGTTVGTLFAPVEYGPSAEIVARIQESIHKQQVLRVEHRKPGGALRLREVEPYLTWFAAGRLYLVAHCRSAEDVRTFAVHRIEGAEVLDEPFELDPTFDAAAFTRKGFGVFHGATWRVVIELDEEVAHLVRERRFHHSQRVVERPGGVRLVMECAGLPEIASWVAGFGGQARAVAPTELAERVRRIHEDGLAVTGGGATRGDNGPTQAGSGEGR